MNAQQRKKQKLRQEASHAFSSYIMEVKVHIHNRITSETETLLKELNTDCNEVMANRGQVRAQELLSLQRDRMCILESLNSLSTAVNRVLDKLCES